MSEVRCFRVIGRVCSGRGWWEGDEVVGSDAGAGEGAGFAEDDDAVVAGDVAFHEVLWLCEDGQRVRLGAAVRRQECMSWMEGEGGESDA